MEEIERRRSATRARITELRARLQEAEALLSDKACVYATGSFGRGELGPKSDLDLFIVGRANGKPDSDDIEGSASNELDATCIKADLIRATRSLGIPDFDGDGRYLTHYSVHDFTKTLGTREEDVRNTFTARLLL